MNYDNERIIVMHYKPLFFKFLREHQLRKRGFKFILAGAGALELHIEKILYVSTLDADVHVWNTRESMREMFNNMILPIENFFEEYKRDNTLQHDFMNDNMKKRENSDYINLTYLHNDTVLRLKIFGYDLADINYHPHEDKDFITINRYNEHKNQLNILNIQEFIVNHLQILADPYFTSLYKIKYRTLLNGFINMNDSFDIFKPFYSELLDELYYVFNASYITGHNKMIEFEKRMITKLIEPVQNTDKTYNYKMKRITKTLRRIALVFFEFNVNIDLATLKTDFKFFQDHTSCLTIPYGNDTNWYTPADKDYCERHVIIGNSCPEPLSLPSLCNDINNVVCKWTIDAREITKHCLFKYYGVLMGINNLPTNHVYRTINNLQHEICKHRLAEETIVYKTVKHILYNKHRSVLNLKVGEIYYQPVFNSTTYYKGADLETFSNFETGLSVFIITIPKDSIAYKLTYSAHPREYEILLPIGCAFQIDKIEDSVYIKNSDGVYFRMKGYYITYINPTSDIIDWNIFKNNINPIIHEPIDLRGNVVFDGFNIAQNYQNWISILKTNMLLLINDPKIAIIEKTKLFWEFCKSSFVKIRDWFGNTVLPYLYSFIIWCLTKLKKLIGTGTIYGLQYIVKPSIKGVGFITKHLVDFTINMALVIISSIQLLISKICDVNLPSDGVSTLHRSLGNTHRSLGYTHSKIGNTRRSLGKTHNTFGNTRRSLGKTHNTLHTLPLLEYSDEVISMLNNIIDDILDKKLTESTRNMLNEFKRKEKITETDINELNTLFELQNNEMEASMGLLNLSSNFINFESEYEAALGLLELNKYESERSVKTINRESDTFNNIEVDPDLDYITSDFKRKQSNTQFISNKRSRLRDGKKKSMKKKSMKKKSVKKSMKKSMKKKSHKLH